jgi:hypothetical protein
VVEHLRVFNHVGFFLSNSGGQPSAGKCFVRSAGSVQGSEDHNLNLRASGFAATYQSRKGSRPARPEMGSAKLLLTRQEQAVWKGVFNVEPSSA